MNDPPVKPIPRKERGSERATIETGRRIRHFSDRPLRNFAFFAECYEERAKYCWPWEITQTRFNYERNGDTENRRYVGNGCPKRRTRAN